MLTNTLAKTTVGAIVRYCENAQKTGNCKEGLRKIAEIEFWDSHKPEQPYNTAGRSKVEIAELLLAAARLEGFVSITKKHGQEIPKNFLTEANDIFTELGLIEKQVLCSNYLALCEWRVGALAEAEIWLQNALSLQLPPLNPARLHTFIVESLVNYTNEKYEAILTRLNEESGNFLKCRDNYLLGLFYMNSAAAEENLENFDTALAHQTIARDIFAKSGHKQLFAHAENNIGMIHLKIGNLDEAIKYTSAALSVAKKIDDLKLKAGVFDSLAQIFCRKQDYAAALKYASQAIEAIERTECYAYRATFCETKIKILRKLKKNKKALTLYADTMAWASQFCVPSVRESLTNAISGSIEHEEPPITLPATKVLSVARLKFWRGYKPSGRIIPLCVTTGDYLYLGVPRNSLILFENCKPKKGDLAAIQELGTGKYFVGALDLEFGLVGLEVGSEIELFEESEVEILGKVVGYCPDPPDADGYYKVVSFE